MAARPRQAPSKDLPANLYRDKKAGKNYYRYRHPITGKYHGLGSDKLAAIAAARKLNSILTSAPADLVASVLGEVKKTFGEFCDYFLNEVIPPRRLAKGTIDLYNIRIRQYRVRWEFNPIDEITLRMIDEHIDSLTIRAGNQARSLLIDIFNHAMAKGLCPDNPAALTIAKVEKKARKRHSVEGLAAIRAAAEPWLQNAIDLALLTTQRRSDIIKLKWADIRDGFMYIEQVKTTDSTDDEFEELQGAGYIRIKIDSEIYAVLDRCRDDVVSPFVIHRQPERLDKKQREQKEHWTQIEGRYLTRAFKDARDKAKPYPNLAASQQPGFHEIRALAIHLYKQMGKDPQSLAGHAGPEMTALYASGHATIIWNDVEVGLKLPFN